MNNFNWKHFQNYLNEFVFFLVFNQVREISSYYFYLNMILTAIMFKCFTYLYIFHRFAVELKAHDETGRYSGLSSSDVTADP